MMKASVRSGIGNGDNRPGAMSVVLLLAAAAGLAAAFFATPEALGRILSDDGELSYNLKQKLEALRWASLWGAGLLLAVWAWGKPRFAGLLAALLWAGSLVGFANLNYPDNRLAHPKRLARAILGQDLLLKDYDPVPALRVPEHSVPRAAVPVINIHAHFERTKDIRTPEAMARIMDASNVRMTADMDGGVDEHLRERIQKHNGPYPDRFLIFASIGMEQPMRDWPYFYGVVDRLAEAKAAGARGIKIWKQLGLLWKDENDTLIPVDDKRLDPLWAKAGDLGIPVLIHLADPVPGFEPLDRHNERYEQYVYFSPEWWFGAPKFPKPEQILAQFERVLDRHPKTVFIGAHMMCLAQDLGALDPMFERHPNLYVDLSAMPSELGRQPFTARDFFLKHADRILFGTDGNPNEAVYAEYFRFMETKDEYFDYPKYRRYNAGRWKIYGLNLPKDVLRRVYHDNAAKILGLAPLGADGGDTDVR